MEAKTAATRYWWIFFLVWAAGALLLTFDGVAHDASVLWNGTRTCGLPFSTVAQCPNSWVLVSRFGPETWQAALGLLIFAAIGAAPPLVLRFLFQPFMRTMRTAAGNKVWTPLVILGVGAGVTICAMCLYPPWRAFVPFNGGAVSVSGGYAFLFTTKSPLWSIDVSRLFVQIVFVGGLAAVAGVLLRRSKAPGLTQDDHPGDGAAPQ